MGPLALLGLRAGAVGFATAAAHMLSLARVAGHVEGVAGITFEPATAQLAKVSVKKEKSY